MTAPSEYEMGHRKALMGGGLSVEEQRCCSREFLDGLRRGCVEAMERDMPMIEREAGEECGRAILARKRPPLSMDERRILPAWFLRACDDITG